MQLLLLCVSLNLYQNNDEQLVVQAPSPSYKQTNKKREELLRTASTVHKVKKTTTQHQKQKAKTIIAE